MTIPNWSFDIAPSKQYLWPSSFFEAFFGLPTFFEAAAPGNIMNLHLSPTARCSKKNESLKILVYGANMCQLYSDAILNNFGAQKLSVLRCPEKLLCTWSHNISHWHLCRRLSWKHWDSSWWHSGSWAKPACGIKKILLALWWSGTVRGEMGRIWNLGWCKYVQDCTGIFGIIMFWFFLRWIEMGCHPIF